MHTLSVLATFTYASRQTKWHALRDYLILITGIFHRLQLHRTAVHSNAYIYGLKHFFTKTASRLRSRRSDEYTLLDTLCDSLSRHLLALDCEHCVCVF